MDKKITLIYIILFVFSTLVYGGSSQNLKKDKNTAKATEAFVELNGSLNLVLTPSLSGDGFTVSYELNCSSKVHIKMFNILGTLMYNKSDKRAAGKTVEQHDTGMLTQGIYMIEMEVIPEIGNATKVFSRMNIVNGGTKPLKQLYKEMAI